MRTVVVPRHPGVLSTFGLLGTEVRNDYARTSLQKPPDYDLGAVASVYRELEGQAEAWLAAEGVAPGARRLTRHADVRYRHQGFELTVPWPDRDLSVGALVGRFHERHRRLYTYALPDAAVEIVTLRVIASGRVQRFTLPPLGRAPAGARTGRRPVYFPGAGWRDCPCLPREALAVGAVVRGPAVVEQLDATTVVPPGQRATVDRVGTLVVSTGAARAPAARPRERRTR
jgi:N-methylhydantoinase A